MRDEMLDLAWRLLRVPGFSMLLGYAYYTLTIEGQFEGLRAVALAVAAATWALATVGMEARGLKRDLDAWVGGPYRRSGKAVWVYVVVVLLGGLAGNFGFYELR